MLGVWVEKNDWRRLANEMRVRCPKPALLCEPQKAQAVDNVMNCRGTARQLTKGGLTTRVQKLNLEF
jgi:hypothetical protein